jgi:hypothetical protein
VQRLYRNILAEVSLYIIKVFEDKYSNLYTKNSLDTLASQS